MTDNLQLNAEGKLKHFLTIEGLDKSLLTEILDMAESFVDMPGH
ncbi:MAG: aspartate carbamoyltransferase catalytic subunit, partial [Methylococcaceae bacterium]